MQGDTSYNELDSSRHLTTKDNMTVGNSIDFGGINNDTMLNQSDIPRPNLDESTNIGYKGKREITQVDHE